jgi:hypothetical protein
MLAITVRQPWAWAIVRGGKDVENRTGIAMWRKLEGERILIHGAKHMSQRGVTSPLIGSAWRRQHGLIPLPEARTIGALSMGAIVGQVDVLEVHEQEDECCESEWAESAYYDADRRLRTGLVHILMAEPVPIHPYPTRGYLGVWKFDETMLARGR